MACMFGRPVWELRETMPADEWDRWLTFYHLYDLPDAFFTVAQLGSLVAGLASEKNRLNPGDLVPYFKPEPRAGPPGRNPSLDAAFAFLRANPDACKPKPKPR